MFGKYKVKSIETLDGFKYHFDENRWLMIRPSGTEPIVRVIAEAKSLERVTALCQEAIDEIGQLSSSTS